MQLIFPHYPTNVLIENLRQTRSVNLTIENILEGAIPLANQGSDFEEESPHIARTNQEEQPQPSGSNSYSTSPSSSSSIISNINSSTPSGNEESFNATQLNESNE